MKENQETIEEEPSY